jgi:two-component system response regulator MprA
LLFIRAVTIYRRAMAPIPVVPALWAATLSEERFGVPSPMFGSSASSSRQTRRILVTDDDLNHRHLIEQLLAEEGYEVEGAGDGLAALAAIERTPPALLLLDLRMPKLDGFGVLARLRDVPRRFPIIVITALQDADEAAIAGGAAIVLTKPVSVDALLNTVRQLLA